ncbi:hypothetical protein C1Y11_29175, partial [Pseudomonas sp. FW305-20]|uniref:hypothetical protein n=1 Tax=Pseudomonas sp. FW305-20 TaxID=2070560 RepID=UPI000CC67BDD
ARLHLAYAIFQIENNRLPEAKDALLLLERNSDKSIQKEAHLALARLYMSQSQPNDAIEEYQKLSAEDANRLDLLEEKAFAEYKIGRYQA